jgi:hypothetical protein
MTAHSHYTIPVEICHIFEDGLEGLVEAGKNFNVIFAKLLVHLLQVLLIEFFGQLLLYINDQD